MMNTRIREILNSGGIDADSLLERCMQNEPFMIRLLQKFLLDPTYVRLATAISSADMPTAEEAAHTMKGMCGNLSMDQLFQLLEQQLAALRAGDLEEGSRIMPAITHAYDAAVRAIEQLPAASPPRA